MFSNTVADPGEAHPLIFRSKWGLKGQKMSVGGGGGGGGFPLSQGLDPPLKHSINFCL